MPNANTIRDHRSLFRQLLTGMYDAVLITDPNGHLLELNPRAKEFFQYETDEVIDRPIGLFIPGVTPAIVQRIRAGLDQARHMMLDANCLRKDRTSFSAEVTVSVIDLMDPATSCSRYGTQSAAAASSSASAPRRTRRTWHSPRSSPAIRTDASAGSTSPSSTCSATRTTATC
ncbi:MAG: PAS domain-containing protein [Kiritimatiellae bacterium]|nr:PAS domain-containing protein [Kiritimatiellia bacterium]